MCQICLSTIRYPYLKIWAQDQVRNGSQQYSYRQSNCSRANQPRVPIDVVFGTGQFGQHEPDDSETSVSKSPGVNKT